MDLLSEPFANFISFLNVNSERDIQPSGFKKKLKPHQLSAIYEMARREKEQKVVRYSDSEIIEFTSFIGILGDPVGTGKTLITLGLIANYQNIIERGHVNLRCHTISSGFVEKKTYNKKSEEDEEVKTNLIIVPPKLVRQWENEIKLSTNLKVHVVRKNQLYFSKEEIESFDIFLCSSNLYNQFIHQNWNLVWNRVIYDEADSLNIPRTEESKGNFYWFITSTYQKLTCHGNFGFFRKLFWRLSPFDYYPLIVKSEGDYAHESFNIPRFHKKIIHCLTPTMVEAIQEFVSPKMLEFLHSGDINGAILEMGGDVETDHNLIELLEKKTKEKINNINAKKAYYELVEGMNKKEKEKRIEELEQKSQRLKERLENIQKEVEGIKDGQCNICMDNYEGPSMLPCCHNIVCGGCLITWIESSKSKSCPLCRSEIELNNVVAITQKEYENKDKEKKKGEEDPDAKKNKLETLMTLVKTNKNKKIIVFAGTDGAFGAIESRLKSSQIEYRMLKGTTFYKNLRLFQERDSGIDLVLLNARFNGSGLNIPETEVLILYHKLEKHLEEQVVGRAQRPGRTSPLQVYHLLHDNE